MPRLLFCALLLLAAAPVQAGIYSWKDEAGSIHFSDTPKAGASEHRGGAISSIGNPGYNLEALKQRIPYRNAGGAMLVQAQVNGVSLPMIVDTGAAMVVIPPAVAREAGIGVAGAPVARLQTANGQVDAPRVRIGVVQLGGVERRNVDAVVQKISPDGRTGLLGMSFLSAFRVSVDHDRAELLLEPRQ